MKQAAIVFTTAALATMPGVAVASSGQGHGQGPPAGPHGTEKPRKHDPLGSPGRCDRLQRVAFVARGSVVSFDTPDPGDLVIKVTRANHHAAKYVSKTPLSTVGAHVSFAGVTDANADNAVGFDDVLGTDAVMVIGKLVRPKRGCDGETTVQLRKVLVKRPVPDNQPEAPEQD
jgi:hypothetical protein